MINVINNFDVDDIRLIYSVRNIEFKFVGSILHVTTLYLSDKKDDAALIWHNITKYN